MEKIRILILSDEVWNDNIHGNNVLTNWFSDFDAEIANIFCNIGVPDNSVCRSYFQITDTMMVKSLITKNKAGYSIRFDDGITNDRVNLYETKKMRIYKLLKTINLEIVRVIREVIWTLGKYNINDLKIFIEQFKPEVIFCARKASLKILRLERMVKNISDAPLIVFTGDDEYSLKQFRISPLFWIHRFYLRRKLSKNTELYSLYYTHSEQQGIEYKRKFLVNSKTLFKGAHFTGDYKEKRIKKPITLVYAGKLYCNRWKSLAKIVEYISKINKDEIKILLNIYTKDEITKKQNRVLNDKRNSFILGPVNSSKLKEIYEQADVALHVESLDLKNRLLTRYSFSTKIIDCLNSTCAVMAICWKEHTGYKYLKSEDAAICVDNYKDLENKLKEIVSKPNIIADYRMKAWKCGSTNHDIFKIRNEMYSDFKTVVNEHKIKKLL